MGRPLVGTPEQIVDRFGQLADIGVGGVAMTWVNFQEGISQFNEQVLPLMVQAGLRQ
jgi:dimethylsulfone monooxygenase